MLLVSHLFDLNSRGCYGYTTICFIFRDRHVLFRVKLLKSNTAVKRPETCYTAIVIVLGFVSPRVLAKRLTTKLSTNLPNHFQALPNLDQTLINCQICALQKTGDNETHEYSTCQAHADDSAHIPVSYNNNGK